MKNQHWAIFLWILVCSCQKQPLTTPESTDREIKVQVTSSQVKSGLPLWGSTLHHMKILILRPDNEEPDTLSIDASTHAEEFLTFRLMPGSYRLFFLANAYEPEEWRFSRGNGEDTLVMNLKNQGSHYSEASDFFAASKRITVNHNEPVTESIDLTREIASLRIELENIPEEITDIRFRLSGTPIRKHYGHSVHSETGTIEKEAEEANESGTSITTLRLFPTLSGTQEMLSVIYTSEGITRIKTIPVTGGMTSNHITRINGQFIQKSLITFSITHESWSEDVLNGGEFSLLDNDPLLEEEEAILNLLSNGSFESWDAGADYPVPTGWKYDTGGIDRNATQSTNHVEDGQYSLLLKGKTYIYQDVPVIPGITYRITLHVNSPESTTKWRMFSAWRSETAKLPQDEDILQPSGYNYATSGYIQPLDNRTFTAPEGAKYFRVEIRNYESSGVEGLYLDNFIVEAL